MTDPPQRPGDRLWLPALRVAVSAAIWASLRAGPGSPIGRGTTICPTKFPRA
jgi:hypothetical protein